MADFSKLDANQILKAMYDDDKGELKSVSSSSLVPSDYDEVDLGYTGSDLTTVTYKKSGSAVATLTLSYSGGNLTNVVKS